MPALLCGALLGCNGRNTLGGTPVRTHGESMPGPTPPPALEAMAPTEPPAPKVTFVPEGTGLPGDDQRLTGEDFSMGGRVVSDTPLARITMTITCDYNEDPFYPYVCSVTFPAGKEIYAYSLADAQTTEGASLDTLTDFSLLHNGYHTLTISAFVEASSHPIILKTQKFYVLAGPWNRLRAADFSSAYRQTLDFFDHHKERFLYRYQQGYDRYLVADPDWEAAYLVDFDPGFGRAWRIHRDALPNYEKAAAYLASVHLRVHGTCGDTGVILLYKLVDSYNGSYVCRFITGTHKVSHHAFGTATDINASMPPNLNTAENNALVGGEVEKLLSYNGILTEDGEAYYDFTYSGNYMLTRCGVPQTVVNYLLYELAFYRAGFQWGHYYRTKSDAMHFSLTDDTYYSHDGKGSLRKVYTYIEP